MLLWNIIYEFFVKYIFGGILGNHYYNTILTYDGNGTPKYNYDTNLNVLGLDFAIGNYMSLIATLITMIFILFVIGHFIKKAFNLFGRII